MLFCNDCGELIRWCTCGWLRKKMFTRLLKPKEPS